MSMHPRRSHSPDAVRPPTPDPEDDLIDLTSDAEETNQQQQQRVVRPPPPAMRSVPGSVLAQAPSPKLLMQQQMMREFEQTKKPPAPTAAAAAGASPFPPPSQSPPPQPISHYPTSAHVGKPRLQLSSITHTVPSPATPAASSTSASSLAARPIHSPLVKPEYSLFNQRSSQMTKADSSYGSAAAASQTTAATSTPAAAASNIWQPSQQQPPSASQWHTQSQATPSFTPPASSLLSTQRTVPHSAPPARSQRALVSTANSAASFVSLRPPAAAAAPAAASSSSSSIGYVLNPEEQLVARRTELQDQIADLDQQEAAIATKRRLIKAELRSIEGELNKPMQLPYAQAVSNVPVPAVGGVSSLISGSAYWAGSFPWDSAALDMLQTIFGIQSYRISQREVINATMDKKDVFVIMPTGAGKSLLYQLPALLNEGITLVISPLLSLMEDQVLNLRAIGIESYMLSGTTSKEDARHIHAEMLDKHSRMRLLYVTPEKIAKSKQFLAKLEKVHAMGKLVRIVIDEVHCCSNWGHDFRPDYAKLTILKVQFRDVPILAVTATATDKVVQDCQQILGIRGCQFFKCSFNRPNLHFSVRPKSSSAREVAADMYAYIESIGHLASSGIVYCFAADTRVLTSDGYLFESEIAAALDDQTRREPLLFACFDKKTGALVYGPGGLVCPANTKKKLLTFVDPDNDMMMRVTPDHDMFVQVSTGGRIPADDQMETDEEEIDENTPGAVASEAEEEAKEPERSKAGYRWQVTEKAGQPRQLTEPKKRTAQELFDGYRAKGIRFQAVAPAGVAARIKAEDKFFSELGLQSKAQVDAFLEMYGYWLGDGSLDINAKALSFHQLQVEWLREILPATGLAPDEVKEQASCIFVLRQSWFDVFHAEYGKKYDGSPLDDDSQVGIKSAKWFFWWVLKRLGRDQCRLLLRGLWRADDSWQTKQARVCTSSVRFRDQVCAMLANAGYAAHFVMDEKDGVRGYPAAAGPSKPARVVSPGHSQAIVATAASWAIDWSEPNCAPGEAACYPTFDGDQMKEVAYDGPVWCVTVAHPDHLLLAQGTEVKDGVVVQASRPVIVGNCYSKKETEELSAMLSSLGLSCDYYHSDVSPERKQRLHHRWVQNQVKLIVATNAFGLGINKPDVRYVLHQTFPAGISLMYQEGGRAGRDGLKAYCCLWYSARDLARQSIRVYAKQDMTAHLYPMVAYCHTQDQCRRVLMARHFGESFHASQCHQMCDVCDALHPVGVDPSGAPLEPATFVTRDLSEAAVQICEFVVDANAHGTEKAGGKRKRASKGVGSITQLQLTDECRKRNSSLSLPKDLSREECERLVMELVLQGILVESFKNTAYTTISYIRHDPSLLNALRRGDLLIKLTTRQATTNSGGKPPKKPTAAAAAKRRTSKKGTKAEAGAEEEFDAAADSSRISQAQQQPAEYDDDFDLLEPEPEVELDDEPAAKEEDDEEHEEAKGDEVAASQSSEDVPIVRKRLKAAEAATSKPKQPTAAAAGRAPASASSVGPRQSSHAQRSHSEDDFMDFADDEDAYQAMLYESAQH